MKLAGAPMAWGESFLDKGGLETAFITSRVLGDCCRMLVMFLRQYR